MTAFFLTVMNNVCFVAESTLVFVYAVVDLVHILQTDIYELVQTLCFTFVIIRCHVYCQECKQFSVVIVLQKRRFLQAIKLDR